MKVKILAFDPGTANCGFGCLEGDETDVRATRVFGVIRTKKADGDVRKRIDIIGERAKSLISDVNPTHIVIEDYTEQGIRSGKNYKELAWLTEHLRLVARGMGYEPTIYENRAWKKIALGVGHTNKQQVKHYVRHAIPNIELLLNRAPDHVWDAFGMALAKRKELLTKGELAKCRKRTKKLK